jgi:hypothetical protein
MKKLVLPFLVLAIMTLVTVAAAPTPPPQPNLTVEVVNPLPTILKVGESYTIEVKVTSDTDFNYAALKPDPFYPGKFVVFEKPGGDRVNGGKTATLFLTITAKNSTAKLGGPVPLAFMAGARYQNGVTVGQRIEFEVLVP